MAVRFLPLICFPLAILALESNRDVLRPNIGDYIRKGKRIGNVFDEQFIDAFPPVPSAEASREGAFDTQKMMRQLHIAGDNSLLVGGEPECACLSSEELDEPTDEEVEKGRQELGNETDIFTYGIGCNKHDLGKAYCSKPCSDGSNSTDCVHAWCKNTWCWVNDDSCTLNRDKSGIFASRHWSYATCHDLDVYKHDFSKLVNETFNIGLNHHAAGWLGAFSKSRKHFEGPLDQWTGPAVSFIKAVSEIGQINLVVKTPEDFLVSRSEGFMKTNSKFDLCIYATALGYLDMCIASYVVTSERAAMTDWVILGANDLYLVTKSSASVSQWTQVKKNLSTIFQPFEWQVWAFAIIFVIPCMGMLMVYHERGRPGGSFPVVESIVEWDDYGIEVLKERHVPIYEQLTKSVYVAFLSALQMDYSLSVLSIGASLNLIGITFFILTFIAVYTANLATILTEAQKRVAVSGMTDANFAGLRLCASRTDMEVISSLHGIDVSNFIPDPITQGGDGRPGFQCATCAPRARVLDFLDQDLADLYPDEYCHAAIVQIDDLRAANAAGFHCNKTEVGSLLGQVYLGLPLYHMKAKSVSPLLLYAKNRGVYDTILMKSNPVSQCQKIVTVVGGETASLGVDQLTGIWVVSGLFAILGLCVTFIKPWWDKKLKRKKTVQVTGFNQKGHKIKMMERGYSWIEKRGVLDEETGRIFVKDPFDLDVSRRSNDSKRSTDLGKKGSNDSLREEKKYDSSFKLFSYSFCSSSDDEMSRSGHEQNGIDRTVQTDAVADENPQSAEFHVGLDKGGTNTSETTDPITDRDENLDSSSAGLSSTELCSINNSVDINDAPVLALNISPEKSSSRCRRKKDKTLTKRNSQRRSQAGNPFSAGLMDGSSVKSDDSLSMASDESAGSTTNVAPPEKESNESPNSRPKTL